MTQDEAISAIGRVDIKKYPSLMDILIECNKHNSGLMLKIYFSVQSNRKPYDWVRLSTRKYINPEDMLELDVVCAVRNLIAFALLHELDECVRLDGKVVARPHVKDPDGGADLTIQPCICSTYACVHRLIK
jgi:hypothetical protein